MVIFEPVQNAGGSFTPPAGYFQGVREICDRYGILLCADEVITGFGRVGAWFGSEKYDIRPDLMTTAKGLSSSYASIGAVLVADHVYDAFADDVSMYAHGIIRRASRRVRTREENRDQKGGDGARVAEKQHADAKPATPLELLIAATARHWPPVGARAREGQGDRRFPVTKSRNRCCAVPSAAPFERVV